MPIAVDPASRRISVMTAAIDLIAEGGLAGVTFRNLAARLGCSTVAISHYFRDKRELLAETYRATVAEATSLRGGGTIAAIAGLLPVDAARRRIWTVWLAFWTEAMFDDEFRAQHREGLAGTRTRIRRLLERDGMASAAADAAADDITEALFGIAVQALFDPGHWTAERQCAAFARSVAKALPQ